MRHLKLITFLLLATFICSCQRKVITEGPPVQMIDTEAMSELVIRYSAILKDDKHLNLEDSRVAYDTSIQQISLEYSTQSLLTVYDARLLIVEVVEGFLELLNDDPRLQSTLIMYPFTSDNMCVKINCTSFYGLYLDPLYVGAIWLYKGCTYIYAFDRKNNDIDWDHHRFEPYFKSRELALIKKQVDDERAALKRSKEGKVAIPDQRYMPGESEKELPQQHHETEDESQNAVHHMIF